MKSGFRYVAMLAAALVVTACGHEGGNGVAIIDLTAVAQATGQDEVIQLKAEANREELMNQLQQAAMSLDEQIAGERAAIGENPTPEQEQQLQMMTMQARQQLGEMQQQAQQQVTLMEQELVNEFRADLSPMAEEIARGVGANVVLAKDAYVFWSDDSVDITEQVIAAWRARPAEAKEADVEEVVDAAEEIIEEVVEEAVEEIAEAEAAQEVAEDELAATEEELAEAEALIDELEQAIEAEEAATVE